MDIQKEREAFEAWWEDFHNGRQIACDYVEEDNSYAVGYANAQWVAWQAAKAKKVAVPESFILMPKEPEKDTLIAIASVCIGDEFANLDEAKELYKAVIEAQELSHD